MSKAPLIYYVEDDEHIRDLTAYALHQAGMEVRAFHDGDGLVERCAAEPPDAVLLDIMLPGDDGLVLLQALRGNTATENMPIMMLTAKGTEFDTVSGLDAGADDYLAKPFGMMELVSRVNALLRRAAAPAVMADDELTCGPVVLRTAAHAVEAGGNPVTLTLKEFDLLRTLMVNNGRVLTRSQLLEEVWGITYVGETRTVDVHIQTLRQKLAAACPGADACIGTVRGVGYCLKRPS